MRYRIVILDDGASPVEFAAELVFASDDRESIDKAVSLLRAKPKTLADAESVLVPELRPGVKGRQIYVKEVDPDDAPPGFEAGMFFDSAQQLSDALGFKKYNRVATVMRQAEKEEVKEAIINGLTLIYTDNIKAD